MNNNQGYVFVMVLVTIMIVMGLTSLLIQQSLMSAKTNQMLQQGQDVKVKEYSMIQDCANRLMNSEVIDNEPDSIGWGVNVNYTFPDTAFAGITCNIQHKVVNYAVVKDPETNKPIYEISSGGMVVEVKLAYNESGNPTGFVVMQWL